MGMSTHVVGFRPPDERFQQMKKVWDACIAAKIPPPKEVRDFFNGEPPDSRGVVVDIKAAVREWSGPESSGHEIDIPKLPEGVKVVRVYNSW